MNQKLQDIFNIIQQSEKLDAEQKDKLLQAVKDADKEFEITLFKLDRTEKVKRTTAILLEETIEELEQKRKAVEEQNRELEIETALEKVRSSALSMKQPEDMVDVCRIISDQLTLLGVKDIRNVQTAIINEKKGTYINYQYFTAYQKSVVEETEYDKHPKVFAMVLEMKRSVDAFFSGSMVDEELNIFREYRKQDGQFPDPMLDEATEIHYNFYSIGLGGLGLTTYKPLPESALKIFKRFHNVFTLAYRRFIDIQKAEAQAREAQIEAALERVRAKAMAMHSSEDISDTMGIVFTELPKLGISSLRCGVVLLSNESYEGVFYAAATTEESDSQIVIGKGDMSVHPVFMKQREYWTRRENYFFTLSGEDLKSYYKEIFRRSSTPYNPKEHETLTEHGYYFYFSEGMFYVWNEDPYSEESINILTRFKAIIDLTFRRYIDLHKAEERAREAQIEAALERVRSRSMAMHKTDELQDVVRVVAEELKNTGVILDTWGAVICTYFQDSKDVIHWTATEDPSHPSISYLLPYFKDELFDEAWESKNRGDDYYAKEFSYDVKNAFFKYAFEHSDYRQLPDEYKKIILDSKSHGLAWAWSKNSAIMIPSIQGDLPSEKEKEILIRFAKVFEQAYTRFLDLKRAEAQARKAQIETALERVRARSMAMHQTDELNDVLCVLLEQFDYLGINPVLTHLTLFDEANEKFSLRLTTSPTSRILVEQIIDIYAVESWKASYENWKKGDNNTVDCIDYPPEELPAVWEVLSEVMNALPEGHKINPEDFPEGLYTTQGRFKFGYLGFNHRRRATEEEKIIVSRFATEFGRSYQRFLDIQKAEKQAREAQIETALERVRARSLAMHNSKEMQSVANAVYDQMLELGIETDAVGMSGVIEAHKDYDVWIGGSPFSDPIRIPFNESTQVQRDYNEVLEQRPELFAKTYSGEIKKEYINHLLQHGEFAEDLKRKMVESSAFSTSISTTKNSGIQIVRYNEQPYSDQENEILKRFAKVFEQAYIRFMDLQKAEAQAREAQIEAALERVRSRTMGMQSSNELKEVVENLFDGLKSLGVDPTVCNISLMDEKTLDSDVWSAHQTDNGLKTYRVYISHFEHPFRKKLIDAFLNKIPFSVHDLSGEMKKSYIRYLIENVDYRGVPVEITRSNTKVVNEEEGIVLSAAYMKYGFLIVSRNKAISKEESDILQRFAKIFEQTYTRFLDLKKAEEQNKIIQADNDRKTKELEDARKLQLSMLPKELPQVPNLDIAVYMKTATEVGGDYYDFNVDARGNLTVLVGDATGHGMMSGMMVSIMKTFFTSKRSRIDLIDFFENANNSIKEMQLGRLMMALIGVQITSDKIIATNAGMPSLLYYRNKSRKAGEFVSNNLPLGGMKNTKYLVKGVRYEKGDTVLLMSDGFAELENSQNEQYGYERIKEKFRSLVHKTSNEIIEELKVTASEWTDGTEPDDDVTFVVIKFI